MMDSSHYFNPYTDKTFLGVFVQLALRLWGFMTGQIAPESMASDEIQMMVLAGVAASSALVGTFLVLRKMTMLANSLSHTILVGIVMAFMFTGSLGAEKGSLINIHVLFIAALAMGLITTFLTELLTKWARLQEDASVGIVFTSLFAIGVIAVTLLTRNIHIGTEAVMGNADALSLHDGTVVYVVLGLNLLLFFLFFKEYKITTFDAGLSRAFGISPTLMGYLLMVQVSLTAISAFRAVGVLMVLAFITGPVLAARLLVHSLKNMLITAVAIGVASSLAGVALSRHVLTVWGTALSTGGVVVCIIAAVYLLAALYANAHILLLKCRQGGYRLFGINKGKNSNLFH